MTVRLPVYRDVVHEPVVVVPAMSSTRDEAFRTGLVSLISLVTRAAFGDRAEHERKMRAIEQAQIRDFEASERMEQARADLFAAQQRVLLLNGMLYSNEP